MRKFIRLLFLLLLSISLAQGANYYVATDGDDEAAGDIDHPWQTLAKIAATVSSGDTVYLRDGTWNEKLSFVAKDYVSWVTVRNYPGETPIIDGTDIYLDPGLAEGLVWVGNQWENGSSYIRIQGLTVNNSESHAISVVGSNNVEIVYNYTHTSGRSGVMIYNSHDVLVDHNDIQKACKRAEIPGQPADEPISIANGSHDVEVSWNYFHNAAFVLSGAAGGEGINVKGGDGEQVTHDVIVHHNIVDQWREDEQPSNKLCYAVDGWDAGLYNVYFYCNIARNGKEGLMPESEAGGTVDNVWFWNNVVYNCRFNGIYMPNYMENDTSLKKNIYLLNNTIYDCTTGARFQTTAIENIVLRNNIFANCTNGIVIEDGVPEEEITQDHNLVTDDPKFVNAGAGDFHLESDSAAIDDGTTIVEVTDDYDGLSRPQGDEYDIGAYEYDQGDTERNVILKSGVVVILKSGVVKIIK